MRIPGITSNEVRQTAATGKQKKGRPPCACFLRSAHPVPQEQQTKKGKKKKNNDISARAGLDRVMGKSCMDGFLEPQTCHLAGMLVIYLTHGGTREEVDSIISFVSTTGVENLSERWMDGEAERGGDY